MKEDNPHSVNDLSIILFEVYPLSSGDINRKDLVAMTTATITKKKVNYVSPVSVHHNSHFIKIATSHKNYNMSLLIDLHYLKESLAIATAMEDR